MMKTILQNAFALIASLVVALFLLAGIEWISAILHPFPPDFDGTRDAMMQIIIDYPAWLMLLGGLGWGITMTVSTWLATRLSSNRHPGLGIGVGLLLLGGAIFNMVLLPYPIWLWILELVLLPLGIYLGVELGMNKSAEEKELIPQ